MRNIKYLLGLMMFFLFNTAFCQHNKSTVTFHNPLTVSVPNGYSHVAKVDLGNAYMLILSGQVALDGKGNLIGSGDFTKQTQQVFQNIKNIIEASGGSMSDLVKLGFLLQTQPSLHNCA